MHNRNRSQDARKLKQKLSQTFRPPSPQEEQDQKQIGRMIARKPPEIAKTPISEYTMVGMPGEPDKMAVIVPEETAESLDKEKSSLIKIKGRIYFVEAITTNEEEQHVLVCAKDANWERDRTGRGTWFHHGEAGNYYAKVSCEQAEDHFFYKIKVYSRKKNRNVFKQVVDEDWESSLSRALREADNMIACCRASDHKKKPGKKAEKRQPGA